LKVTNGNIKKIYGYDSAGGSDGSSRGGDSIISLDTIHYGQSKEVVLLVETTNDDKLDNPDSLFNLALNVSLEYKSYTNKTVKLDCYEISPINSYDSLKKPIVRLEFVELIANIIKLAPCEATNIAIANYLSTYDSEYYKNDNESVLFDLKGQVKLASSDKNYYYKWGMNYLYSLMCANRQQKCNNFKDKSVEEYGGDIFKRIRDDVDTIYSDMEPPVPSQSASYNDSSGSSGAYGAALACTSKASAAPALSRVQFVNAFNNRSGGCFHEDCEVLMADKTTRPCEDIKKGDVVSSANDETAVVVCVIKIKCENDMCRMVNINGLNITEYHPVKNPYTIEQEWVFPRDVGTADAASAAEDIYCEYMYNFVLDSKHMVNINNVLCVTLGHGFTENAVIAHDYYGTDKVINDLKKMKGNADSAGDASGGYEEGLITLKPNCVIRDENGKVVGIYSAACY
jgi:hypothetical protein